MLKYHYNILLSIFGFLNYINNKTKMYLNKFLDFNTEEPELLPFSLDLLKPWDPLSTNPLKNTTEKSKLEEDSPFKKLKKLDSELILPEALESLLTTEEEINAKILLTSIKEDFLLMPANSFFSQEKPVLPKKDSSMILLELPLKMLFKTLNTPSLPPLLSKKPKEKNPLNSLKSYSPLKPTTNLDLKELMLN